jgi:AraC-like DNA-binding protein
MKSQNITLAADEYMVKPFNIQEAVKVFNNLLGMGTVNMDDNLIEGAETRRLEGHNASMTTATESMDSGIVQSMTHQTDETVVDDDEMNMVETTIKGKNGGTMTEIINNEMDSGSVIATSSMLDVMDRQLLMNIQQYVLQNMSRGQINLEELAGAMGMGRVPFFHKVRNLTGKTPAELIRDLRLKHACILLKRTNINMSELAVNTGFMTAENFINTFKEKFGLSPLEYRLKWRK